MKKQLPPFLKSPLRLSWLLAVLAALVVSIPALLAQKEKPAAPEKDGPVKADVVVYGGTPAGVAAAIAAADKGLSVVVVEMTSHIGGMISGGLVETDIGDRKTVGGTAHRFFEDIKDYYLKKYGADSRQYKACREGLMYEPSAGERIFDRWLAEKKVQVFKKYRLASVKLGKDGNIASFAADNLNGGPERLFIGKIFIDASYEGDLMAEAGVKSRIGREGRDEYGEYLAGISVGPDKGKADHRYQTYNYRVAITNDPNNRVPFPKPDKYDPSWAQPFAERVKKLNLKEFSDLLIDGEARVGPNQKWDLNWGDLGGANDGYADGDWGTRERIADRYRDHFLSGLYFLQNSPDLPKEWLENMKKWGLPKDEFVDTGHFPYQMYIRQARRMVGQYILTEHDLTTDRYKPDGVCSGSYGIDCHAVRLVLVDGKRVMDLTPHYYVSAYDIPYATLVPKDEPGQPKNLLVPVCLSTSHVAYCSVRMEPVYMMLGQAAGNAAWLALKNGQPVQEIDVKELRDILRNEGAILDSAYSPQVRIAATPEHPKPGETVEFSVVSDEVRAPLKNIWWDFEGNGKVSAQGEKATVTFEQEKVYNVSLLIEDENGRRRLVAKDIPVGGAHPLDITIDDADAVKTGRWDGTYPSSKGHPDVFIGPGMRYELVGATARDDTITFQPTLSKTGRYEVSMAYRPAKGQSDAALVKVAHAGGEAEVKVDQTKETTPFPFVSLGEFRFEKGDKGFLTLSNPSSEGKVVVDGARWTWIGE